MDKYNQRVKFAPGGAEACGELKSFIFNLRDDAEYEKRFYMINYVLERTSGLDMLFNVKHLHSSFYPREKEIEAQPDDDFSLQEQKIVNRIESLTDVDKKQIFEHLKEIIHSNFYEEDNCLEYLIRPDTRRYCKLSEEKKKILHKFIKEIRDAALPPFKDVLIQLMNAKDIRSSDLFMRANIDRHFLSKIMCSTGYIPKKKNVMAIALALHLSLHEYDEFMLSAGYVTDPYDNTDLAVRFCIIQGEYDPVYYEIDTLNSFLAELKEDCFEFKRRKKPFISRRKCKGCGLCAKNFPDIFEIKYGKSSVKSSFSGNIAAIEKAAEECPSNAMEIR